MLLISQWAEGILLLFWNVSGKRSSTCSHGSSYSSWPDSRMKMADYEMQWDRLHKIPWPISPLFASYPNEKGTDKVPAYGVRQQNTVVKTWTPEQDYWVQRSAPLHSRCVTLIIYLMSLSFDFSSHEDIIILDYCCEINMSMYTSIWNSAIT